MKHLRVLTDLAARQHWCVARRQCLEFMTRRQLEYLLKTHMLQPLLPSVYRMAVAPDSWRQLAKAATLWMPGSAVSHRSAAQLHGLRFPSAVMNITAGRTTRANPDTPRIDIHHSRQLHAFTDEIDGIPATCLARTFVDLSSCAMPDKLAEAIDWSCYRDKVTLDEVRQCLDDMYTMGRSRISIVREILAGRNSVDERLDSKLEAEALALLRTAKLPDPEPQKWLIANGSRYRADLIYREQRIDIEPDGPHHLLPSVAAHDRKRDADFNTDGWIVIRYGLYSDPGEFVQSVVQALTVRAGR